MSDEPITGMLTTEESRVIELRLVGDINFHIDNRQYTYDPSAVQPGDLPYLLLLFTSLIVQGRIGPLAIKDFVDEHNLWHCFKARA